MSIVPTKMTLLTLGLLIGTALYIYGILINIVETDFLFTTNVHLILTVDNQRISYQHEPLDTDSYEYQVPVFSLENLPNQSHSVRVALNPSSNFLVSQASPLATAGLMV